MSGTGWRKLLDLLIGALLGGATLALYTWTLAPTVLAGDGGEFQFVPYLLGVAHSTGYPLYTMLGWLWSHLLPLGDVAYRLNLFSALGAALAMALLYPAARSLLRQAIPALSPLVRRLLAILATATFAVTPTLWSQAIIAEVYGLHTVFIVLLLYLILTWSERRRAASLQRTGRPGGRFHLLLTAFCFGLSLAHHSTTLLLAPALLAYVWLTDRHVFREGKQVVLPVLLLALLPLALYLYIPLRAPHTPYLRLPLTAERELVLYENSPANFLYFVLGGPFGGSVDFSVDLSARLAMASGFFFDEIGWGGVLLALIGVAGLIVNRRWALLGLTGLTYAATVAFNLVYTIGDIYVLYIPAYLVMVLWMVVGVGTLVQIMGRVWSQGRAAALAQVILVLLFFTLPAELVTTQYAGLDQSRNTRARARWEAILAEPLPPDAVLVSNDRNNIMPLWYFQYVDGVRPDLLGLFPLITPEYPTLDHVLDLALSTGRPVYLIKEMPGVEVKVEVEPKGSLWRVLGPAAGQAPAYPRDVRLADTMALVGCDRAPHSPRPGETLQVSLYWEALRPLDRVYHTFIHLLDAKGRKVAQSDHQPGGIYYPSTLWQPGERLRDDHLLEIPADTAPGVYHLVAGVYAFVGEEGGLELLDGPVSVGRVAVKTGVPAGPGEIGQPVGVNFGDQIELLGYDTETWEDTLTVTLHWRALRPPVADYTVFVHLLDAGGETIAQHDGQPVSGAYPTSVWDEGEAVADEHSLSLPPDPSPGDYWLRVGLYLLETGQRLPVVGDGDSIELGPIVLE